MDLIVYLSQLGVVTCKKCQIGVLPNSQWGTHFRKHHINHQTRQKMRQRILEYPEVIENDQQLGAQFQYPVRQPPIPHVTVYRDGLACEMQKDGQTCEYVGRSQPHMKEHCRDQHGWINEQGRGGSIRQRRSIERPWRKDVCCQRLFHAGPKCGYFEVRPPAAERHIEQGQAGSVDRGLLADRLYDEIRRKQEAMESDRIEPGQKLDANPWLKRVGWARHLSGFEWDTLIPLIALPREEETTLKNICDSFDRMINIGRVSPERRKLRTGRTDGA